MSMASSPRTPLTRHMMSVPVSPCCTKSEGSSPLGLDRGQTRFFRTQQNSASDCSRYN